MKIINYLFISFSSKACFFVVTNADVTEQYHADEKRNVKQPPLLGIVKTFCKSFIMRYPPPCMMS